MFDVCVIGHVTRDIIRMTRAGTELPGGVAYYFSMACKSLGSRVTVVTKCREDDRLLLSDLVTQHIPICFQRSEQTTTCEHTYLKDPNVRREKITGVAAPFTTEDIPHVSASVFHVGPLTKSDISVDVLTLLSQKSRVSLDIQGFLRHIENGKIRYTDWEQKEEGLRYVNILKADETEAKILSGQMDLDRAALRLSAYGINEIIITRGNNGSVIYAGGKAYPIPAFIPTRIVDPTGCGDTYMAGYIFKRLQSCPIDDAGNFAAAAASLKLERSGPFRGTEQDVQDFLDHQRTRAGKG
ncbi:MAG: PfkB family carbohydrate kinase [Candidatus Methylomirabilales bacterium]